LMKHSFRVDNLSFTIAIAFIRKNHRGVILGKQLSLKRLIQEGRII
jgi:hypothetical protein